MDEMSPKLQNQIAQFQQLQQQLQAVLSQKFQMEAQLREVNNTIEELEKIDDETPIFKNVGSILMKTRDKESTIEEIKDDKETLEVRVKTLNRQEKQMRERLQSMQTQLQRALGGGTEADQEN